MQDATRRITATAAMGAILTFAAAGYAADAPTVDQQLADINTLARAHYASAKAATLVALSPIIVVEPDAITLIHNGAQHRETYLPDRYRSLKALAHVPMGLYSLAAPHADKADFAAWRDDLVMYRARVSDLAPRIGELGLHWDDAKRQRQILAQSLAFMDQSLAAGGVTTAALRAYANEVSPALLGNAYDASEAELLSLDAIVTRWRGELSADEWARLYVVVLGPSRPRERHPPYDYFARLLGPDAVDARLIHADNVTDVAGALDLLATTVNDRRLAEFFFGDAARFDHGLMRELTGRHLDKMMPPP